MQETQVTSEQFDDALFRRKRKNGTYDVIEAPDLPAFVADTHAHLHMLEDPSFSIARAACCGVRFIEGILDVCEDDLSVMVEISLGDISKTMMDCRYQIEVDADCLPKWRMMRN